MTDTNTPTILVVEDDEIARGSLVRALQDADYQTLDAKDGQAGLDLALSARPALIIADNLMPVMKGIELLDKLRKDNWGRDVPFILLTGQYDLEAVNTSLEAGNTDFMVKDETTLSEILETVRLRLAA